VLRAEVYCSAFKKLVPPHWCQSQPIPCWLRKQIWKCWLIFHSQFCQANFTSLASSCAQWELWSERAGH